MKNNNKPMVLDEGVSALLAGSAAQHHEQISKIIDEHIVWSLTFARLALAPLPGAKRQIPKSRAFTSWYRTAPQQLPNEQPLIDRLAVLHDQLHKAAAHALDKAGAAPMDAEAYDHVCACYHNFMQPLRSFDRQFTALAHGVDLPTGLCSRFRIIDDLLAEQKNMARHGTTCAVAFGTIDQFDEINTLHGSDTSAKALAAASDCILKTLRAHDTAYRLGHNTFVLCLRRANLDETTTALTRLQGCLAKENVRLFGGGSLQFTVSFAVSPVTEKCDLQQILQKTETLLHESGGNGALAKAS